VVHVVAVTLLAVVGGCLTYVVLPVPSAAAPGLSNVGLVPAAALLPPPGMVGGTIAADDSSDTDDLLTDPVGVVTATADPAAGGLIGWPVSDHTPSTGFGYRSDPFTHRQRWHDGVDLGQPCGDPVHASLDGTVQAAGWAGGYGNRIIVRHADRAGHDFATTYNHLSQIDVVVGQSVRQGEVVGRVGSTGRSTACHLHFEVILDGAYVDPMRFLTGDQSKAGLSRRVGSPMPSGLPSPTSTASSTRRATPSPTVRTTSPSPSPTSPSPTPTSPSPSPTSSSPSPPAGSPTPTPGTPAPTTGSPTPSPTPVHSSASPAAPTSAAGAPATPSATDASRSGSAAATSSTPQDQTPAGAPA
jgi:hypothetical protein